MNRYLEIRAPGIVDWLSRPPDSPAQQVFWGLLQLPCSVPLVPAQLAERFGMNLPDLSRALFELNRRNSLLVTHEAVDHAPEFDHDFALLCEDLRSLAEETPRLMLATADGLCLAQHGLPKEVCTQQAAICHQGPNQEFPCVIPLHLGSRTVRLCSPQPIPASSAALLRLARRLIGLLTR